MSSVATPSLMRSDSMSKNPRKLGLAFEQARPGDRILIKGLMPGGAAADCKQLAVGDELIRVD
ncbi:hypothetical protein T484DRAFT_1764838, partial [Baffinella frigidus]